MLSLETMSSWLSRDRKRKVSPYDKAAFPAHVTTQVVSNGEHNPLLQKDGQSLVETRVAKFGDESGYRIGRSRREFLQTASGMTAAFFGINRVCGRFFEDHEPEATASGQFVFDDAPLDVARFAAEHWNPAMLEELYLEQKRFK